MGAQNQAAIAGAGKAAIPGQVAYQRPHAGFAADAVDIVAGGDVDLGEHGCVGCGVEENSTPAETCPRSSRLSLRMKLVSVEVSVTLIMLRP